MDIAGSSITKAFRDAGHSFCQPARPSEVFSPVRPSIYNNMNSLQMFSGIKSIEEAQNEALINERKLFQDAQRLFEDYDLTDSLTSKTLDQIDSLKRFTRTSTPQWKLDALGLK